MNFNLQIIDTPGFGDTKNFQCDKDLKDRIRQFFANKGEKGISELHAICFVVSASNVRLTATQKYIFDSMLSIFGKDLEKKIYVLATFADAKDPPVLEALNEYNVPYERVLKFNNSALFANNKDTVDKISEMFWNMGKENFERFFDELRTEESVSLQMSATTLSKQKTIEIHIEMLLDNIRGRTHVMSELEEHKKILGKADVDMNKKKRIKKIIPCTVKVENNYATNCKTCKRTCHVPCKNPFDVSISKYFCEIFTWGGNCAICDKHCPPQEHESSKEKYATKQVEMKVTMKELIEMYSESEVDATPADVRETLSSYQQKQRDCDGRVGAINNLEEQVKGHQIKILELVQRIRDLHNELHQMALRPKPFTDMEYLDLLMEDEKNNLREGWKLRLAMLQKCKDAALAYTNIIDGNIQKISKEIFEF